MADFPASVKTLQRDLDGVFAARLRSLVVYGLRGRPRTHGDDSHGHAQGPMPTHTLAVVDQLTADDLRVCSAKVASWHDAGLATPLILASHEFGRSLDVFPFEFGDILADHVVVAGVNPFDGLRIDAADLRRACEVQARGHLLHLREGYLETRGRADALAELVVHSAPAFAALVMSVARLDGHEPADAAAAARAVEHAIGTGPGTASGTVALVGVTEIPSAEAERLFPSYLDAVERLVTYVDQWR